MTLTQKEELKTLAEELVSAVETNDDDKTCTAFEALRTVVEELFYEDEDEDDDDGDNDSSDDE